MISRCVQPRRALKLVPQRFGLPPAGLHREVIIPDVELRRYGILGVITVVLIGITLGWQLGNYLNYLL